MENTDNHLIDLNDIPKEKWNEIVDLAVKIHNKPSAYAGYCSGKILATLFYEPSTRTQMSFQTAMLKLGGSIIGFDNPNNSSVAKGETIGDTIRVVSGYADCIVIRHPVAGASLAGAQYSESPVINAGDGGHLHPTQTLTDLVTLKLELGEVNGITIGLCGDLKNGRTVHSLVKALCMYENIEFVFISTKELTIPKHFKDIITKSNCTYKEIERLDEAIVSLDVLYMTRIQKERFASEKSYNEQKNVYILDGEKLQKAKSSLKILHPLPRVDEISMEVDEDSRAVYFKQAKYGVYARMALIITLLKGDTKPMYLQGDESKRCINSACITNQEMYLKNEFFYRGDECYCKYCDTHWE